jgi:hypothetical protein
MPIGVGIRSTPQEDGDHCAFFNNAVWWNSRDLMEDPRFRQMNPSCWFSVACLNTEEMRELQDRYRYTGNLEHFKQDSDRLDSLLADINNVGPWWVVEVYEWETGLD